MKLSCSSWLAATVVGDCPHHQQRILLHLSPSFKCSNTKTYPTTTHPPKPTVLTQPRTLTPGHPIHQRYPNIRSCLPVPTPLQRGKHWLEALILKHLQTTWDLNSQTRLWWNIVLITQELLCLCYHSISTHPPPIQDFLTLHQTWTPGIAIPLHVEAPSSAAVLSTDSVAEALLVSTSRGVYPAYNDVVSMVKGPDNNMLKVALWDKVQP